MSAGRSSGTSSVPVRARPIRASAPVLRPGHLTTIAERARARGETAFDVKEIEDQVIATIFYDILFGKRELTPDHRRSLLDRVQSLQPKAERDRSVAVRDQKRPW
jgi:hypothetical protein